MLKYIILFFISSAYAVTPEAVELRNEALKHFKPIEKKKYFDKNKLRLGRMLFAEKKLSKGKNVSCITCHNLRLNGADKKVSPYSKWKDEVLPYKRNTPTLFNSSLNKVYGWDGKFKNIKTLVDDKLLSKYDFGLKSSKDIMKRIDKKKYMSLFQLSYVKTKKPYSYNNLKDAISYFVKSQLRPGRIDDFLQGDNSALTRTERRGFKLFIDKGCVKCHDGRNFGGSKLTKLGVKAPYKGQDPGKFLYTNKKEDRFIFRVASLRNVTKTGPYFHDGKVRDLKSAIRTMATIQLGVKLNKNEIDDIKHFLDSLTPKKRF